MDDFVSGSFSAAKFANCDDDGDYAGEKFFLFLAFLKRKENSFSTGSEQTEGTFGHAKEGRNNGKPFKSFNSVLN